MTEPDEPTNSVYHDDEAAEEVTDAPIVPSKPRTLAEYVAAIAAQNKGLMDGALGIGSGVSRSFAESVIGQIPSRNLALVEAMTRDYGVSSKLAEALRGWEETRRPGVAQLYSELGASSLGIEKDRLETLLSAVSGGNNWGQAIAGMNGIGASTLYERALAGALSGPRVPTPRRNRRPSDFYGEFEAEVGSLDELLKALSVIQRKNANLGLVWRGQQDASWAVESSLTRALRSAKHDTNEDRLNAVEDFHLVSGDEWGFPRPTGELGFFAELQHQGAPTRLIDVSLDPEVAAWFAVESSEAHDGSDARIVVWGRAAVPKKRGEVPEPTPPLVQTGGGAFWHAYKDAEQRAAADWGTGRRILAWQPAAMNERMRAQRAAFLFDAEPIIDEPLLDYFAEALGETWKAREIAGSTRVLGAPSAHDVKAKRNDARIVPMFTLRIAAKAKPQIRAYLARKGLTEAAIYPDRAGLVAYLRRVSASMLSQGDTSERAARDS